MEAPPHENEGLDLPDEADRAKAAAVDALKARIEVEEQAERSRLRAAEAVQAQRAAAEAAERARVEADEAEQARRAADQQAERARIAAEEALQAWREKLAKALEADASAARETVPAAEAADLHSELEGRVAALSAVSADPDEPASTAQCVISYRRELDNTIFYARAFDDEGHELVLAESDPFRTSGDGAPERTEEAAAALAGLSAQLADGGWEPVSHGDAWFEQVFRRRVGAAAE
jgi:hypothetical protein